MSRTAALSWAEFDDEADAPSFDVAGDLATATTLRAANQRPAKPPIPYAYPSLAPHSTLASAHALLPAPDAAPDYSFMSSGRASAATSAAASAPVLRVTAVPRGSSACAGQPMVGPAVFKPFKPPRKLLEDGGDRPPALHGLRAVAQGAAEVCQSSAKPAVRARPGPPGAAARVMPIKTELGLVADEAWASRRPPLDVAEQAAASRQDSEVPCRRVRSSGTSSGSASKTEAGAEAVLSNADARAARVNTVSSLDKSAASMACADNLHASAARQSSVLVQPTARQESTPAGQRSRKKAKRLFPTDVAEAAEHEWQVRTWDSPPARAPQPLQMLGLLPCHVTMTKSQA